MARWITSPQPGVIRRLGAAMAAASLLTIVAGSTAPAQTLTDPNPQPKWSPPHAAAKSPPPGHTKSCSTYGVGFVNVPGTDACIKIGGFVSMDVGSQGH